MESINVALPLRHFIPITPGCTPSTGDSRYSLDTIDHSNPSTLDENTCSVVLKIPEPIGTSRDHFHLRING